MTPVQVFIISVVEGITEFLPVSSTGHMILASTVLHIAETDFVKSFQIIIQLGAILSVVVLYGKKLLLDKKIFLNVCVAFLPTAFIGLVLYKYIKTFLLGNPWIVVWSLGLGGVLLILLEAFHKEQDTGKDTLADMTPAQSLLIGFAQAVSVVPGVSRAAATIAGAMLTGMKRSDAVAFSFLLAIPTMAAATGLDFLQSAQFFTRSQYEILGLGFLIAFLSALFVVKWFLGYVKKYSFVPFAVYRIFAAVAFALIVLR